MSNLIKSRKRQQNGIIFMAISIFVFSYLFYFNSTRNEDVTFGFIVGDEWNLVSEWKVASRNGALIFLFIALIGILASISQVRRGKKLTLGAFVFGLGSILAFLSWAAAGQLVPVTGLLQGAIMLSVPLIFGSL